VLLQDWVAGPVIALSWVTEELHVLDAVRDHGRGVWSKSRLELLAAGLRLNATFAVRS
jgi:hypothetical protein